MNDKGQCIHIYPFNPKTGETKHVIDTDYMCWCKPINKQLCSEAWWDVSAQQYKCDTDCWRCGGTTVCEIYDRTLNTLIVHVEAGKPVFPSDKPLTMFGNDVQSNERPAIPYKCPICCGRGKVPQGFYSGNPSGLIIVGGEPETCQTCDGEGIVWG